MNKIIKTLLYLVGIIFLLIIAAVIILPMVIDPNDYKEQITAKVKEATGRKLVLDGTLGLSVFPWLGVETGKARLSNAQGFGEAPFAEIDETAIRVKILPLLSKKVEISRIVLKGLTLNLAKNAQGVTNWSDLAKSTTTQPDQPKKKEKPSQPAAKRSSGQLLGALAIGGISIENAKVIWDDRQADKHIEVEEFDFTTDKIILGSPIDIDLNFMVKTHTPAMTENFDLAAAVTIAKDLDSLKVADLRINSRTEGEALSGKVINAELTTPVIDVSSELKKIQTGELSLEVNATGEGIPGGKLTARLVTSIFADLTQQSLKVSGLKLTAKNLNLQAELTGKNIIDALEIKGPVTLSEFSPRSFMSSIDMKVPDTKDQSALTQLSAQFDLLATKNSATLNNILIALDETTVKGKMAVHNFSQPAIRFNYTINYIDIDRYLPPKKDKTTKQASSDGTKPIATPATATVAATGNEPPENLRKLDINGRVNIGGVKVSGLKAKNIGFTVKGKNGLIQTQQTIKNLYQGSYKGGVTLNAQGPVAVVSLNESLTNVDLTPLLKDATGKKVLAGIAHAKINLSGKGLDTNAIKKTLKGTITADIKDGAVYGINIVKLIRETKAKIEGKQIPPSKEPEKTEFSEMRLHATAAKGIINNDTLEAKSPYLRVNGAGKVGLVDQSLDYRVQVKIVKTPEGQGGEGLKDLEGIPIPLKITGTTKQPKYGIDIQAALTEVYKGKMKEKIDKEKGKVLEKIEKNIGKEATDIFKKLF